MIKSNELFLTYVIATDTQNLLIGDQSEKEYSAVKKEYFNKLMSNQKIIKIVVDYMIYQELDFNAALNKTIDFLINKGTV